MSTSASEHDDENSKRKKEHEEEITKLHQKYKDETEEVTRKLTDQYDTEKNDLVTKYESTISNLRDELSTISLKHADESAKSGKEHEEIIDQLHQEYKHKIEQTTQKLTDQYESDKEGLVTDYETTISDLRNEMDRTITEHNEVSNKGQQGHDNEVIQLHGKYKNQMDDTMFCHDREKNGLFDTITTLERQNDYLKEQIREKDQCVIIEVESKVKEKVRHYATIDTEIQSLRDVIDLKSKDNKTLRDEVLTLTSKVEGMSFLEREMQSIKNVNEQLEATIAMKTASERNMSISEMSMKNELASKIKELENLSLKCEELKYKINEKGAIPCNGSEEGHVLHNGVCTSCKDTRLCNCLCKYNKGRPGSPGYCSITPIGHSSNQEDNNEDITTLRNEVFNLTSKLEGLAILEREVESMKDHNQQLEATIAIKTASERNLSMSELLMKKELDYKSNQLENLSLKYKELKYIIDGEGVIPRSESPEDDDNGICKLCKDSRLCNCLCKYNRGPGSPRYCSSTAVDYSTDAHHQNDNVFKGPSIQSLSQQMSREDELKIVKFDKVDPVNQSYKEETSDVEILKVEISGLDKRSGSFSDTLNAPMDTQGSFDKSKSNSTGNIHISRDDKLTSDAPNYNSDVPKSSPRTNYNRALRRREESRGSEELPLAKEKYPIRAKSLSLGNLNSIENEENKLQYRLHNNSSPTLILETPNLSDSNTHSVKVNRSKTEWTIENRVTQIQLNIDRLQPHTRKYARYATGNPDTCLPPRSKESTGTKKPKSPINKERNGPSTKLRPPSPYLRRRSDSSTQNQVTNIAMKTVDTYCTVNGRVSNPDMSLPPRPKDSTEVKRPKSPINNVQRRSSTNLRPPSPYLRRRSDSLNQVTDIAMRTVDTNSSCFVRDPTSPLPPCSTHNGPTPFIQKVSFKRSKRLSQTLESVNYDKRVSSTGRKPPTPQLPRSRSNSHRSDTDTCRIETGLSGIERHRRYSQCNIYPINSISTCNGSDVIRMSSICPR